MLRRVAHFLGTGVPVVEPLPSKAERYGETNLTCLNVHLRQQALSKSELERMVLAYIRMLPGSRHAERVAVIARSHPARNWTVLEIEPPLSTRADNQARNAVAALQGEFRLAD
jgi:hypothetical protein